MSYGGFLVHCFNVICQSFYVVKNSRRKHGKTRQFTDLHLGSAPVAASRDLQ